VRLLLSTPDRTQHRLQTSHNAHKHVSRIRLRPREPAAISTSSVYARIKNMSTACRAVWPQTVTLQISRVSHSQYLAVFQANPWTEAILFNQQECESVGETAPGFVGCSPFSLSSFVGLGSSATTMAPSTFTSTPATTSTAPPNPLLSTVSTRTDSDFGWDTVTGLQPSTVSFLQRSVLTGSCTMPNFAIVTNTANSSSGTSVVDTFLFAEVGCSNLRGDCCPFPSHEFAIMPECPLDYFTTADGCCPRYVVTHIH
jgi:hypothetical protein